MDERGEKKNIVEAAAVAVNAVDFAPMVGIFCATQTAFVMRVSDYHPIGSHVFLQAHIAIIVFVAEQTPCSPLQTHSPRAQK